MVKPEGEDERNFSSPFLFVAMFSAIKNKVKAFDSLNLRDIFRALFLDDEFTDLIIQLNTYGQLFTQGVNSKGIRLDAIGGPYKPNTIYGVPGQYPGKIDMGLPYDHITLFNKGAFYNSFMTSWLSKGDGAIKINADTSFDGNDGPVDLTVRWGKDIIGLDEDSLSKLRDMARKKIPQIVKSQLRQAA